MIELEDIAGKDSEQSQSVRNEPRNFSRASTLFKLEIGRNLESNFQ